jgi:hypothetical protein
MIKVLFLPLPSLARGQATLTSLLFPDSISGCLHLRETSQVHTATGLCVNFTHPRLTGQRNKKAPRVTATHSRPVWSYPGAGLHSVSWEGSMQPGRTVDVLLLTHTGALSPDQDPGLEGHT